MGKFIIPHFNFEWTWMADSQTTNSIWKNLDIFLFHFVVFAVCSLSPFRWILKQDFWVHSTSKTMLLKGTWNEYTQSDREDSDFWFHSIVRRVHLQNWSVHKLLPALFQSLSFSFPFFVVSFLVWCLFSRFLVKKDYDTITCILHSYALDAGSLACYTLLKHENRFYFHRTNGHFRMMLCARSFILPFASAQKRDASISLMWI